MPKIIKDLESKLIEEANRQIKEVGYGATTIRSIAKACGVGIGTVYNYFSSKEDLLATYMLEDWKNCITAINAVSLYSTEPAPVMQCIYDQLLTFAQRHASVFKDEAAATAFAGSYSRYHTLLRSQLAQPLQKFCENDYTSLFIAESLLTWSMEGRAFDEIYGIIQKLF